MRDNNCRESIDQILHDAPTARKNLLDNHSNLQRVADYCQNKFFSVENTSSVVEESKALTTQALASVTYQINHLATSLLKLLDAQTLQLKQMESSVNSLSQTVDIYKENIARREIGILTKQSKVPRTQRVVLPANGLEAFRVYRRVPISYARLDKLGHGHWENKPEDATETGHQQINAQEMHSTFSWSFQGIAVPPPSVPDFAGSNITAPPVCSPNSPSPPVMSLCSPSLPPYVYPDLSMLPPPPPQDDEMEDTPPPPPPLFPTNTSMLHPPPPPTRGNMAVPPPPPPPSSPGKMAVPPPPPPSSNSSGPPPPPPPPNTGGFLPPPPPPLPPFK